MAEKSVRLLAQDLFSQSRGLCLTYMVIRLLCLSALSSESPK